MKKLLLTAIATTVGVSAFAQGQLIFENFNNSSAFVDTVPGHPAPTGNPGFAVSLLWYNGSSFQSVDTVQTIAANLAGTFYGGTVTLPGFQSTGTFEVECWYNPSGNYASLAAAAAAPGSYLGITVSFTAAESLSPAPPPTIVVSGTTPVPAGAWNGDLILSIPEPSTIVLTGLGATILLLFRRRKSMPNASPKSQTAKIL